MADIKLEIDRVLNEIKGVTAFFYYPDDFKRLPCISFYEASNTPAAHADDDEYAAEVIYAVDVWAATDRQVEAVPAQATKKMRGIGFVREFSHDVFDPDSTVRHKAMRFRMMN